MGSVMAADRGTGLWADGLNSMRITILAYSGRGADDTFAPVVGQVAAALRKGGHRVSILSVQGDVGKLISGLKRRQPELVFNLMERLADDEHDDVGIVGLLDLLGLPYTSGGPGEAYIQHDGTLARKLLSAAGICADTYRCRCQRGSAAKPNDGRAFFVGLLGNDEPSAFPPVESAQVASQNGRAAGAHAWPEVSLHPDSNALIQPVRIPDALEARLQSLSLDAYQALRLRDYGRVNLRLSDAGQPSIVAVDANCDLEESGEFARAAAGAGIGYVRLVNRIAELAMQRNCREPSVAGHS
jgi:D-alanine-D-alanine ligase